MNERFYLLKIQLLDIEPAIWRRFVVPASITTGPAARCHPDCHGLDRQPSSRVHHRE